MKKIALFLIAGTFCNSILLSADKIEKTVYLKKTICEGRSCSKFDCKRLNKCWTNFSEFKVPQNANLHDIRTKIKDQINLYRLPKSKYRIVFQRNPQFVRALLRILKK